MIESQRGRKIVTEFLKSEFAMNFGIMKEEKKEFRELNSNQTKIKITR